MTDTTNPTDSTTISAPVVGAIPAPASDSPPASISPAMDAAAVPTSSASPEVAAPAPEIPEAFRRRGLEALLAAPLAPPPAAPAPVVPAEPLYRPEPGQVYRLKDFKTQRAPWVEIQAAAKFWRPDTGAHRRDVVVHTPLKGLDAPTFFGAEMSRMVWVDPLEIFVADYERADTQAVSRLLRQQARYKTAKTGWAIRAIEPRKLRSTPLAKVESEDQLCVVKCEFPALPEEQGADGHFWKTGEIRTYAGKSRLVIPVESCLEGGFIHARREEARAAKAAYVRAKGLRTVNAAQYWASSGF